MQIETERLVLRKPRLEDVEAHLPIASDEETMRFVGGVRDRKGVLEMIDRWLARWAEEGFGHLVVERREDRCFLGMVGLLVWDRRTWEISSTAAAGRDAQVEMGWTLGRPHWGRGYATEAARSVRRWANSVGIVSLVSIIHADNVRSQRVAEKLGAAPTETVVAAGHPAVVWTHPR